MRLAGWLLRGLAFLLLLGFAIKNTSPVVVRYYLGNEWQAPLVFVLLITFAIGVAVGINNHRVRGAIGVYVEGVIPG